MNSSSAPPHSIPAERGLRRLRRALQHAQQDRSEGGRPIYVDFSELHAYAFQAQPDRLDDFLGGLSGGVEDTPWMLDVATSHLFRGWSGGALRMLPPHRAELAAELRRFDEQLRGLDATRQRVDTHLSREVRDALIGTAKGSESNQELVLLRAIMRGHISELCFELVKRDHAVRSARRSLPALRELVERGRLSLGSEACVDGLLLTTEELHPIAEALSQVRPHASNVSDARALAFLRHRVEATAGRVLFVSRSTAMHRALSMLCKDKHAGRDWERVRACMRVPESILVDFLAGSEAEGCEWLKSVQVRVEHFLAQLQRACEHHADHERIGDTVRRAWSDLNHVLNLRRSIRPDVSKLLRKHAGAEGPTPDDALEPQVLARLIEILSTPSFQKATRNEISKLLYAIERGEWRIALDVAGSASSRKVVVAVRDHADSGTAIVEFTAGAFGAALHFGGAIRQWLRAYESEVLATKTLADGLLRQGSDEGAEGSLLLAALLGVSGRWTDALPYADQAVDDWNGRSGAGEAYYFRALCRRKIATIQALTDPEGATQSLREARKDIEWAIERAAAANKLASMDPRYGKELGAVILTWVDAGFPEEPKWTRSLCIGVLDAVWSSLGEGDAFLQLDVLNNLCYALGTGGDPDCVSRAAAMVERLEQLSSRGPRDVYVQDTIMVVRAHDAERRRDRDELVSIEQELFELVGEDTDDEASMTFRRVHLEQVRRMVSALPMAVPP